VFIVILLVAGTGYFAMASYETRAALYRQRSSEAFYLADGGIENARAKYLDSLGWHAPIQRALGNGTYDVRVWKNRALAGHYDVDSIVSTGHVQGANRRVEVMALVRPSAFGLSVLIMRNADVTGNLCLTGSAHINGDPDPFHLSPGCGHDTTSGFIIEPPPIYTEPGYFPNSSYYYVKGTKIGTVYQARIFDRDNVDITGTNTMTDVVSFSNVNNVYVFSFNSNALLEKYFNDSTGIFKRNPGDVAAVVNFGEQPLSPAGVLYSNVVLDGNNLSDVHATVINTRFTGTTTEDRINYQYWEGDAARGVPKIELKQIIMEPYNGIAMICWNAEKTGTSHTLCGTADWPALLYITHDVVDVNSTFSVLGSLICLRDFHSTGTPAITYNGGFISNLPEYLRENWPDDISATMRILRWREITAEPI
jgi:hypothetical protein